MGRRTRTTAAALSAALVVALAACGGGGGDDGPELVPWSADDVDNPMRGQYVWDPVTRWPSPNPRPFPQSSANATTRGERPWPSVSTYYTRVAWADLESDAGTRSGGFPASTVLEERIAAAAKRGQRTIFRVVAVDTGAHATPRRSYPGYVGRAAGEWRTGSGSSTVYVPDWNSPAYLAAFERLVAELGRRYDADPRVAGFEVSGYGTFGEWNDVGWGSALPPGRSRLSEASMRRLVDATITAFPTTQLFVLTDPALLRYALARSPRIGIRVDCLGQWSGGGAWERILSVEGAADRWRTAPIATEYCQSNYGAADAAPVVERLPFLRGDVDGDLYENARRQVLRWHVSLVSSGNFPGAGDGRAMTDAQLEAYGDAARWAGYRYASTRVELPESVSRGETLEVAATWANLGVAPAYSAPRVDLELRPAAGGEAVVTLRSGVDLGTLVADSSDDGAGEPQRAESRVRDALRVPASAPPGRYDLVARVRGTTSGVAQTLQLAQEGRTADGGYRLGSLDVTA